MSSFEVDPVTENEKSLWPSKPLVDLQKPFVDKRGSIQPLVDLMMKSAVMIESKAGSLREIIIIKLIGIIVMLFKVK